MITYRNDEDSLIIYLSGRIDTNNADEFKAEMTQIRDENPFGKVVIDVNELDYISSAGLRVIMQFKKHESELVIINASPSVYEIFDVTGFTQMINIKRAVREISVANLPIVAKGSQGTIYRLDDETIVKLFNSSVSLSTIEDERARAQKAMLLGVPTAIAYDVVRCGDCYGLVFEMINAKTLSAAIMDEPENFDMYVDKYIGLFNQLHECTDEYDEYTSLKEIYYELIDNLSKYLEPIEIEKFKDIIDAFPEGDSLVHGDLHPNNIMVQKDELVIIDMAQVSKGSPFFDLAGLYRDIPFILKVSPERFENTIGMNAQNGEEFFNAFLESYYADKTDAEFASITQLLSMAALALASVTLGEEAKKQDENLPRMVDALIKKRLMPIADTLISMLEKVNC